MCKKYELIDRKVVISSISLHVSPTSSGYSAVVEPVKVV